jgi:hypothetical protein
MIGRWQGLTIDCASPRDLATFYEVLLGYRRLVDDTDWVVIGADERWPAVAFQQIPNYVPPTWPSSDRPSHMHIDVRVDDLSRAEAKRALTALEEVAQEVLPPGMGYDWADLSYQEKRASSGAITAFALSLLFVFLILAALYESWSLPFSVLLTDPIAVFGAMIGQLLSGYDLDVPWHHAYQTNCELLDNGIYLSVIDENEIESRKRYRERVKR